MVDANAFTCDALIIATGASTRYLGLKVRGNLQKGEAYPLVLPVMVFLP